MALPHPNSQAFFDFSDIYTGWVMWLTLGVQQNEECVFYYWVLNLWPLLLSSWDGSRTGWKDGGVGNAATWTASRIRTNLKISPKHIIGFIVGFVSVEIWLKFGHEILIEISSDIQNSNVVSQFRPFFNKNWSIVIHLKLINVKTIR